MNTNQKVSSWSYWQLFFISSSPFNSLTFFGTKYVNKSHQPSCFCSLGYILSSYIDSFMVCEYLSSVSFQNADFVILSKNIVLASFFPLLMRFGHKVWLLWFSQSTLIFFLYSLLTDNVTWQLKSSFWHQTEDFLYLLLFYDYFMSIYV